ncbi:hypothetical protein BDW75DRAFT_250329 [Aspergillus navahoensis]
METQTLDPFLKYPLAVSLLKDPSYTLHALRNPNPSPKPNRNPVSKGPVPCSWEKRQEACVNPFFRVTNHYGTAVLQTVFLVRTRKATQTQDSEAEAKIEGHLLLHVDRGITRQTGIAHGGFLATVMDEVCGNLIAAANLEEGYKRPVLVPEDKGRTVIVALARVKRFEGEKVFIDGVARDGAGVVCTTAEAVFVRKKVLPATL